MKLLYFHIRYNKPTLLNANSLNVISVHNLLKLT